LPENGARGVWISLICRFKSAVASYVSSAANSRINCLNVVESVVLFLSLVNLWATNGWEEAYTLDIQILQHEDAVIISRIWLLCSTGWIPSGNF
jgi:hypothetical protein